MIPGSAGTSASISKRVTASGPWAAATSVPRIRCATMEARESEGLAAPVAKAACKQTTDSGYRSRCAFGTSNSTRRRKSSASTTRAPNENGAGVLPSTVTADDDPASPTVQASFAPSVEGGNRQESWGPERSLTTFGTGHVTSLLT